MARYFTPPILLGLSLTSVSIAVLYVLYKKVSLKWLQDYTLFNLYFILSASLIT